MSEYTKYFIVKSNSENEVKEKLNKSKIISIVDSCREKHWFSDGFKIPEKCNWFPIFAPAISGFKTAGLVQSFYYQDRFEELKELFEEENAIDWKIDLKFKDKLMSKEFYSEQKIEFNNEEKQLLEEIFNAKFIELESLLKPGLSMEFLNFNGIPYMQMGDQDKTSINAKGENYSFLASEIK